MKKFFSDKRLLKVSAISALIFAPALVAILGVVFGGPNRSPGWREFLFAWIISFCSAITNSAMWRFLAFRKQLTFNVNGVMVPEPCLEEPGLGKTVWTVTDGLGPVQQTWVGTKHQKFMLGIGRVHMDHASAKLHFSALNYD